MYIRFSQKSDKQFYNDTNHSKFCCSTQNVRSEVLTLAAFQMKVLYCREKFKCKSLIDEKYAGME